MVVDIQSLLGVAILSWLLFPKFLCAQNGSRRSLPGSSNNYPQQITLKIQLHGGNYLYLLYG